MMKAQGGVIFAALVAWVFLVLCLGMIAQAKCPSTTMDAIQKTPKALNVPKDPISALFTAGSGLLDGIKYLVNIVLSAFNPCSGIPFYITTIFFFPVFAILLLKVIQIIRGGG